MKMKAKQTMHIDAYPSNKGLERHATHIAKLLLLTAVLSKGLSKLIVT